jgi:hypothetical protein
MRTVLKSIIIAATLSVCSLTPKMAVAQDQPPVTLQTFYDQLSPYGQWVNYPPYGSVFIPNAGPGFIPYSTAGHWEFTEQYGWTWASDYQWGWACFHYGRWNFDPSYGWFWVPDTQWGPAWVVWRNSDQYYGWAPLPSGVDINMGINNGYGISPDHWCFVPNNYMGDPFIYRYYMPRGNNDIFIMHSAIIFRMNYDNGHHYGFFAGPDRFEVERYRHSPIQPTVIVYNSDPHHVYGPHEVGMYRPTTVVVERHDDGMHHDDGHHDDGVRHDAPVRVVNVQQVPQRGGNFNQQQHPAPAMQNHPVDNHVNTNNGGNRGGNNNGNNNGQDNHGHH